MWNSRRRSVREMYRLAARYKEMVRISDHFGADPLLRYGEDRWGIPDNPKYAKKATRP